MLKDLIKNEIKLILVTFLLGSSSLIYLDFEFSKLENYKGIINALTTPFYYGMNGFIIMAWYIVMITCLSFIVIEIISYNKNLPKKVTYSNVIVQPQTILQQTY